MKKVLSTQPVFGEVREATAELESLIANGPIVPTVTPEEIRTYLTSRYDFRKPLELDDVITDMEKMLRKWQRPSNWSQNDRTFCRDAARGVRLAL